MFNLCPVDALPPPSELGAPDKFSSWRPEQIDAVMRFTDSQQRFHCYNKPTGSGKSLTAYMCGLMSNSRTLILTATKSLQDLYATTLPVTDVRGQNNYVCHAVEPGQELAAYAHRRVRVPVDKAPCREGIWCKRKTLGGCDYYDALRVAQTSQTVITNYAFWLAAGRLRQTNGEESIGNFDLLVLDEAHAAADAVCSALHLQLEVESLLQLGLRLPAAGHGDEVAAWKTWARNAYTRCGELMDGLKSQLQRDQIDGITDPDMVEELRQLRELSQTVYGIANLEGQWVVGRSRDTRTVDFDPVWASPYCERLLFRGIPKVILLSATVTRKSIELLGIKNMEYIEYPSSFPVVRRPIYIVPTARVDHRMDEESERMLMARIDQIIRTRAALGRKGIIHSVSYERAHKIRMASEFRDLMITHTPAGTADAVRRFKAARGPAILISPSVVAGEDFPDDECRYIIVPKLPFRDLRSPVMRLRDTQDKSYAAFSMMENLIQSTGRGMRSATDWCETFILDSHALWAIGRRGQGRFHDYAPDWWRQAVEIVNVPPQPLEV